MTYVDIIEARIVDPANSGELSRSDLALQAWAAEEENTQMTILDDRRKALEDKYILDFEQSFKVRARRNRLLAEWVAAAVGRNDVEAYVEEVLEAGLKAPGDTDLLQKIAGDFEAAGQLADANRLREKMHDLMYEAAEAVERETESR